MKLSEIHFPVYRLNKDVPLKNGTILYYRNTRYNIDNNTTWDIIRIIDDTSINEASLGRRRLHIPNKHKFPIRRCYMYPKDLIRQGSNGYWLIDSSGKLFQYTKSTKVPLICRKITNILPGVNGIGSVIEVEKLTSRFKTLYIPNNQERYAGLLKFGRGYLLYGLFTNEFKDTWRMV